MVNNAQVSRDTKHGLKMISESCLVWKLSVAFCRGKINAAAHLICLHVKRKKRPVSLCIYYLIKPVHIIES